MSFWYFVRNNHRDGPVSAEFLADEYRKGRLNDADMAWCDALTEWTPIGELPEITELARAVPPPVPVDLPEETLPAVPAVAVASEPPYAKVSQRFFAYLADQLLLAVPFFILLLAVLAMMTAYVEGFDATKPEDLARAKPYMLAFGNIVAWLYYVGFQTSRLQATPGMILVGLRLSSQEGERVSMLRGTVRHLLCSLALPVTWVLALFTPSRQMMHDVLTDTVVTSGHDWPLATKRP